MGAPRRPNRDRGPLDLLHFLDVKIQQAVLDRPEIIRTFIISPIPFDLDCACSIISVTFHVVSHLFRASPLSPCNAMREALHEQLFQVGPERLSSFSIPVPT